MARFPQWLVWSVTFGAVALLTGSLLSHRPTPLDPAPARDSPPARRPLVVLAAGDSITAASYPGYLQQLFGITAASYPGYLQQLFDEAKLTVRVVNAGVKGHTSGEYLAYLKSRDILGRTNPDFIILQLGTNDVRIDGDRTETSRYYDQMNEILDRMLGHRNPQGTHPVVFVATIPPVVVSIPRRFDDSSRRRVTEEINPTIHRLAAERALPLVDTYDLFARRPEWLPEIHPNEEGYRALARLWFDHLSPPIMRIVE